MKTGTVKNESIFHKLINKIKHSTLFEMFFNPSTGSVTEPGDVTDEQQLKNLAASSGISEKEAINIDAAFNNASGNLDSLRKVVEKIPEEPKDGPNPFAVDEEDLLLEEEPGSSTDSKSPKENDREIGE